MTRISKLGLSGLAVGALALTGSIAHAQVPGQPPESPHQQGQPPSSPQMQGQLPASPQMVAESTSVARGEDVWKKKGCAACHNVAKAGEEPHRRPGGKQAGPDLAGVTQRRDREWLRRWLKDPDAMRASDPVAIAMVKQAQYAKMPNMKLSDAQIEALLNYLDTKPGI